MVGLSGAGKDMLLGLAKARACADDPNVVFRVAWSRGRPRHPRTTRKEPAVFHYQALGARQIRHALGSAWPSFMPCRARLTMTSKRRAHGDCECFADRDRGDAASMDNVMSGETLTTAPPNVLAERLAMRADSTQRSSIGSVRYRRGRCRGARRGLSSRRHRRIRTSACSSDQGRHRWDH